MKYNLRDRTIYEVFLSTGIRVHELCSILKDDVFYESNTMFIKGKGSRNRYVIFKDQCKQRLQDYLKTRKDNDPHLFVSSRGKGFATRSINFIMDKYLKLAGFEKGKITPHTLRRTFATNLYKNGMELNYIRRLMGHENIKTTLLYTQIKNIKYI